MGRKSSIETLPPEVKAGIDEMLREGRWTLDQVLERIREEYPDAAPSRSALGRYKQNFEQLGAQLRESREVADIWAQRLGEDPESDVGKVVLEILRTLSFRVGADLLEGDTPDPKVVTQLSRAMTYIERAGKLGVEREKQVREEAARAAADAAEEVAEEAGMSGETIQQMKQRVMGIAG